MRNYKKQRMDDYNRKKAMSKYLPFIILFILILTWVFINKRSHGSESPNNTPNSTDRLEPAVKSAAPIPSSSAQNNGNKNNPTEPSTPATSNEISATITNTRLANSYAQVSILVSGTNHGACKMTMTDGSITIERSVGVISRESVVTCEDFNIPSNQLHTGRWDISLIVETNGAQSKPTTSVLEVP